MNLLQLYLNFSALIFLVLVTVKRFWFFCFTVKTQTAFSSDRVPFRIRMLRLCRRLSWKNSQCRKSDAAFPSFPTETTCWPPSTSTRSSSSKERRARGKPPRSLSTSWKTWVKNLNVASYIHVLNVLENSDWGTVWATTLSVYPGMLNYRLLFQCDLFTWLIYLLSRVRKILSILKVLSSKSKECLN